MTVYDLARRAGVSTATVSRVLNNSGPVKEQTRRRVLDALEASNYTVNEVARSLAMQKTQSVAILTTDVREYYYAHLAYEIERTMGAAGYNAFLCNTGPEGARQADYIQAMLSKRVSGMVVLGSSMRDDALVAALLKASRTVPVVMTNASVSAENVFCIERDDAAGTRLAVAHLAERGCHTLCFVADFLYHSDGLKRQVCLEACAQRGLTCLSASVGSEPPLADGYVCSSDMVAARLIKTLYDRGIKVPQHALIVGYDNTDLSELTSPTLTSIDSDILRQTKVASDMLLTLLRDGVPEEHRVLITPTLICRESA